MSHYPVNLTPELKTPLRVPKEKFIQCLRKPGKFAYSDASITFSIENLQILSRVCGDKYASAPNSRAGITPQCLAGQTFESMALIRVPR